MSDADKIPFDFCDGDLCWFRSADVSSEQQGIGHPAQLLPEGVQLVRAASVGDSDAWQLYQMVSGPFAAALVAGEPLLLLGPYEQFFALSDGDTLVPSAGTPGDGQLVSVARVDGGGLPRPVH